MKLHAKQLFLSARIKMFSIYGESIVAIAIGDGRWEGRGGEERGGRSMKGKEAVLPAFLEAFCARTDNRRLPLKFVFEVAFFLSHYIVTIRKNPYTKFLLDRSIDLTPTPDRRLTLFFK